MIVAYQLDPHKHVALEASSDSWIRFMHNTHTPAPYGYGWTITSLIPYVLGFGKFTLTLGIFKAFMILGLLLLWMLQHRLASLIPQQQEVNFNKSKWLFFLSPLVLIETIGNVHNDVWMMVFVFAAYISVFSMIKSKHILQKLLMGILTGILLFFSFEIKFASIALVPVFLLLVVNELLKKKNLLVCSLASYWSELSSLLLFIPLFTSRSQLFHPWYLIWSLSFLPFIRMKIVRLLLISFSISSMFRYIPFLYQGEYLPEVMSQQLLITWGGGLLLFFSTLLFQRVLRATMK